MVNESKEAGEVLVETIVAQQLASAERGDLNASCGCGSCQPTKSGGGTGD